MSYLSRRMREDGWPRRAGVGAEPVGTTFSERLADAVAELGDLQLLPWQQHMLVELDRLVDPPARGYRAAGVYMDEVARMFVSSTPEPLPVTYADIVRAFGEVAKAPKLPGKIKLTSGEWESIPKSLPEVPWLESRLDVLAGVPVEIVDDPADSDLFELRGRQNGKCSDLEARFGREGVAHWPLPGEGR